MEVLASTPFERISFSRQFFIAGAVLLAIATIGAGTWMGHQIEANAVHRSVRIASAYVESTLAAHLHGLGRSAVPSAATRDMLDRIFENGPLSRKLVRFRLWAPDGRLLYGSRGEEGMRRAPDSGALAQAFSGRPDARVVEPVAAGGQRLIEVHLPIHDRGGAIVAVAEFHHSMDNIDREIRSAQGRSWLMVVLGAIVLLALLHLLAQRANATIVTQRHDLRDQLRQLRAALAENEAMQMRLREAGARTTAMNEQTLQRIAADLHDGPAQTLAFALMRFDDLVANCEGCTRAGAAIGMMRIRGALTGSLDELRAIAGGLGVPGIAEHTLAGALRLAVRKAQCEGAQTPSVAIDESLADAPLATTITAFRLVQEALNNARRHAAGKPVSVSARREGEEAVIEVRDEGPGFDPELAAGCGRLGLAFMRERVRLLGGRFELLSAPGKGTLVRASLPLARVEAANG
ncbi:MAG: sensor histidine kinase [Rhodocyclaceae bacterium]